MKHISEMQPSQSLFTAYEEALGDILPLLERDGLRSSLWPVIHEVIVIEARIMRGDAPFEVVLSRDGVICEPFSGRLVDRLLTDPERSSAFLRQISSDVADFLAESGRYEGSWGSVVVSGKDLVLRLTAREKVPYEPSRARVLKIDLGEEAQ